jgi:hypothetical protein
MESIHRRKIQLVAGVTYSVSLPKPWVERNRLKNKSEIAFVEKGDGSLVISPAQSPRSKEISTFSIVLDDFKEDVSQALFVLYYFGTEKYPNFLKKRDSAGDEENHQACAQVHGRNGDCC